MQKTPFVGKIPIICREGLPERTLERLQHLVVGASTDRRMDRGGGIPYDPNRAKAFRPRSCLSSFMEVPRRPVTDAADGAWQRPPLLKGEQHEQKVCRCRRDGGFPYGRGRGSAAPTEITMWHAMANTLGDWVAT